MKKILISLLVIAMGASFTMAATNLLGTRKDPNNGYQYITTWANPASTPSGIVNATGATTAYPVASGCDKGMVKVGTITGTGIMNVAMQVADLYGPQYGSSPLSDALFTNAIGTDAAPYHQVDPTNTDTWKFDFSQREFTVWRLNCLAGCSATNYIETAWGRCSMSGMDAR